MKRRDPFFWVTASCGLVIMTFILLPLIELVTSSSFSMLGETIKDKEVVGSIRLSIVTAGAAALISFVFGTPLAYFLARRDFRLKRLIEALIDLPIVIPHPVVGIAILGLVGKNHWIGRMLGELGVRVMGSTVGIVTVLTFVGLPLYIHAAKEGFESISPRLEAVSRSLGASMTSTFFSHHVSPGVEEHARRDRHVLSAGHQRIRRGGDRRVSSHDRSGAPVRTVRKLRAKVFATRGRLARSDLPHAVFDPSAAYALTEK